MNDNGRSRGTERARVNSRLRILASSVALFLLAFAATAATTSPAPARDPEQRNRQYQHAEALYLSGRLKEAAAAFDELARVYPNDARIWLKYGNTLTKLGNLDNAATAFQNAAAADPSLGNSSLNLALVRLAQAQAALDAALARLAANSDEHAQADALQRQLNTALGTPDRGNSAH